MEQLQIYFQMLKRGWWLIALAALAALNAVLIASYFATPMFRSKTSFIVSPGASLLAGQDKEVVDSIEALDKRSIVSTYAEVLKSDSVFNQAAVQLGLTSGDLSEFSISAVVLPDASVLELTIEGSDPDLAAQLANEIGLLSIEYIEGLYLVYNINQLDPATPASAPFSPQPVRDAAVALFLGGAFGAMLAILMGIMSTPFTNWQRRLQKDKNSLAQKRRVIFNQLKAYVDDKATDLIIFGLLKFDTDEGLELLSSTQQKLLLRQITAVLQNELRGKDIVGRWHKDQFALLLPGLDETSGLAQLETVRHKLAENPITISDLSDPVALQVTIGVASWQDKMSADTLMKQSEEALNQAHRDNIDLLLYSSPRTNLDLAADDAIQSHLSATPTG